MSEIPASAMAALERLTDPAEDALRDAMAAIDSMREEMAGDGDADYLFALTFDASSALERLERLLEEKRG